MGISCSSQKKKTDLKMILDNHPKKQIISNQQSQNSQLPEYQFDSPCNQLSKSHISEKLSMKQEEENINNDRKSPDPASSQVIQQESKFQSFQLIKNEPPTQNTCDRRILKMIRCQSCGRQINQKYSIKTLQNIF